MPVYLPNEISEVISRIREKLTHQQVLMGETLSEQQIIEFEKRYGLQLPKSYRRFLLEIGNGGEWGESNLCSLLSEEHFNQEKLLKPFPFENEWIWESEEDPSASQMEAIAYGNLELTDAGCGQSFHLILNGKCYGEVWHFSEMGIQPCCQRQDFLGWYEKWLDDGNDVCYFEEYPY